MCRIELAHLFSAIMSKRDFIAAADLLFSDKDLKYAVLTMAITTRARHARPIKTIVLT